LIWSSLGCIWTKTIGVWSKQQPTSMTRYTHFFIKLPSLRPDVDAIMSRRLHAVFTNHVC
jgi:hypothetical protein